MHPSFYIHILYLQPQPSFDQLNSKNQFKIAYLASESLTQNLLEKILISKLNL